MQTQSHPLKVSVLLAALLLVLVGLGAQQSNQNNFPLPVPPLTFAWMPSIDAPPPAVSAGTPVANTVFLLKVHFFAPFTANQVTLKIDTISAGGHASAGLYNLACTALLASPGAVSTATLGIISTAVVGGAPILFPPGDYYYGVTADNTVAHLDTMSYFNAGTYLVGFYQGTAANPSIAGVLPASCGTVTQAAGTLFISFWN